MHQIAKKQSINILTWNIEGLITGDGTNKLRLSQILKTVHKYDIICLNETWQDNDRNSNVNGYTQYTSFRRYKHKNARRNSGGVAVLVRNSISKGVSKLKSASDDCIWLKLEKDFFGFDKNLYLCCCYLIPQHSSTFTWNDINNCEILETEVLYHSNLGNVLICGDLNARTGDLKDFVPNDNENESSFETIPLPPNYHNDNFATIRNNTDHIVNEWGQFIADLCISARLCILNGRTNGDISGKCTCIKTAGISAVDYNIITKDLFKDVNFFKVNDFTEWSDHCPISMSIKANNNVTIQPSTSILKTQPPRYIWDSNRKDLFINAIAAQTATLSKICENTEPNTIDDINKIMCNAMHEAAKVSLKLVKVKHKRKPSNIPLNETCYTVRKHLLHTKKLLENYPNNRYIRECYYSIKKIFKKAIKKAKNTYRNNILTKLEELKNKKPQEYWNLLNKLRNQEKQDHSSSILPDKWIKHFNKLFTPDYNDSMITEQLNRLNAEIQNQTTLDYPFSEKEIYESINSLKNRKASGPDGILNEMLKCGRHYLVKPILHLFNMIISEASIPQEWKTGYLRVIYKSGDINLPENYRGIAICSCLGKLFTKTLNNRLQEKLESEDIYSKHQAGFRKDYRTSDNVYILSQIIKYYKSNNQKVFTCFVDFKKAFDTVSRPALFVKMAKLKIGGNFLKTIQSLYENDNFNIKIGNKLTEPIHCRQGVRQGDGLSSTLFNIFINDLPSLFNERNSNPAKLNNIAIGCLLYADDLVIMSESQTGLQCSLNKLAEYCQKWHLKVNSKKTEIIIFNSKGQLKDIFKLGGETIKTVNTYKYLGIILHRSGTFSETVKSLSSKALKALFIMQKSLQSDTKSPIEIQTKVFDAVIVPILTYCSEIWGQDLLHNKNNFSGDFVDDKSRIEIVHMRFCKRLLRIPQITSNIAVRSELGRLPILNIILQRVIKYYTRLESLHENRLAKIVYLQTKNNRFSINKIANHYNEKFSIDINNTDFKDKVEKKKYIQNFNDAFLTYTEEEWYTRLNSPQGVSKERNKLRLYSKIKNVLSLENYLKYIHNPEIRQSITKVRISAHTLAIEKERHNKTGKIHLTQRICKCCNTSKVENEFHFIMKCPLYKTERDQFLSLINTATPTSISAEHIFINLMKCINVKNTAEFGSYVNLLFKKRKQYFSV